VCVNHGENASYQLNKWEPPTFPSDLRSSIRVFPVDIRQEIRSISCRTSRGTSAAAY
jgi:hypothetical protein